nr:MAG TPA: hypothetical protein [Caudoviricetes sp.]
MFYCTYSYICYIHKITSCNLLYEYIIAFC